MTDKQPWRGSARWGTAGGRDVPDPYGGSAADFAEVRALLESGMSRLAAQLSAVLEADGQRAGPGGPA